MQPFLQGAELPSGDHLVPWRRGDADFQEDPTSVPELVQRPHSSLPKIPEDTRENRVGNCGCTHQDPNVPNVRL